MMRLARWTLWIIFLAATGARAQSGALLSQIWNGVQKAQNNTHTVCGNLTETRTSVLMARPMVLRGHFCAEGMQRFALDYLAPHELSVRFDTDLMTVQSAGKSETMSIGSAVRRAQSSFSREKSIDGLKKNFEITATENAHDYELRFLPRAEGFRKRINFLVVKLDKRSFLPHSLEVSGKSGVDSVYALDIKSVNEKLPAGTFQGKKKK